MRIRVRRLAWCVCASALLAGCQGPRLPAANFPPPPRRPLASHGIRYRSSPANASRPRADIHDTAFGRAKQALVGTEDGRTDRPGPRVSEAMIAAADRAVRARMRAAEQAPPERGMAKRARELPPLDKGGDGAGCGIDPLLFLRGVKTLLERGRLPHRLR